MKKGFRQSILLMVIITGLLFFIQGCGGNDGGGSIIPTLTGNDKVVPGVGDISKVVVPDMMLTASNEDEYYDRLEKILNNEYSFAANAPKKAPGDPYLTAITLGKKTDEILTLATYDLAAQVAVTATLSNKNIETVTPTWIIYSGVNSMSGNIYTAPSVPGTTVFIAVYSKEGINRYAIFRLKYNGLASLVLGKTTDEVQASGVYDLSAISVMAKDSNGILKNVTNDANTKWSLLSGRGTFIEASKLYTAAPMVDSSLFMVSYTENGMVQSAQFTLRVTGQTALALSKTTDEITLVTGSDQYDLSNIIVTVKYSTGATKDVTNSPDTQWSIYSGKGILNGKVYTTAAIPETAILKASYTEGGITKIAYFTLKIIGLTSIVLNKTTDEIWLLTGPATYDLSPIVITAKYSSGNPKDVSSSPNLVWTKVSGGGTLSGKIYTTSAAPETATFRANYTEGGITKIATFTLKVIGLYSISLNPSTDSVLVSQTYDFNKIIVTAKYSNNQTRVVKDEPTMVWTKNSGLGTLSGKTYTATAKTETAVFTASYTEAGIKKTAVFRLYVVLMTPSVETPIFSPVAGTYSVAQSVTISCTTAGADIYYTADGSTPTASSTKYTGVIDVSLTKTIKAIAIKSGMTDSTVASAAYTINIPPVPGANYNFVKEIKGFAGPAGVATDLAGNLYVTDDQTNNIKKYTRDGVLLATWGQTGSGIREFNHPDQITVDPVRNCFYVADRTNHRIQKLDLDGNFIAQWNGSVSGINFSSPVGVVIDNSTGDVFVGDKDNNRIVKFDMNGGYITSWDGTASGKKLSNPCYAGIDQTNKWIYIADESNHRVVKFNLDGSYITQWSSADGRAFNNPEGITVDKDGNIYASDWSNYPNHRVVKLDSNGNYLTKFESWTAAPGSEPNSLNTPLGIAVDPFGDVYIADYMHQRVVKFSQNTITPPSNNNYEWSATLYSDFYHPTEFAIDSVENLYITDCSRRCVKVFDIKDITAGVLNLTPKKVFGSFSFAAGIAIDSNSNTYVTDYHSCLVQKFDSNGNLVATWGKLGGGYSDGEFYQPWGIAIDSSDNVYIADVFNHRIQKFDSNGNFITKWGKNGGVGPNGGAGLSGTGNGEFNEPSGLAIDSSNNLYVSDQLNHRIQKFDSNGNFITKWGRNGGDSSSGDLDGEFRMPTGLGIDSSNNIFVADHQNHRIQKFDSNGNFKTKIGANGNANGEFNGPIDILIDRNGNLYIADHINDRVQKFVPVQ